MTQFYRDLLKAFIRKVYSNPRIRSYGRFSPEFDPSIGPFFEALVDSGRGWVIAEPDLAQANIPRIRFFPASYYRDGYVNRPIGLRKVNYGGSTEIWIANYGRKISRFTSTNFEYVGDLGVWGNPGTVSNGYAYPYSIAVNENLNLIAIAMQSYHRVRIFEIDTWNLVAEIGDGSPGNIYDGRLWNPIDVEWAGDTLLITCRSGYAVSGQNGPGHITAWDAYGNFIGVVLRYQIDGSPSNMAVNSPYRARVFPKDPTSPNLFDLYVSYKHSNVVGKFTLDIDTLQVSYETTYAKPMGVSVSAPQPVGLDLGPDGTLYVACDGPKVVAGVDVNDHSLKFFKGFPEWDDKSDAAENPGALWGIWDILHLDSLFGVSGILVADYGNNRVAFLPIQDIAVIPLKLDGEIPSNAIVDPEYLPKGVDLQNKTWIVLFKDIGKLKRFVIPYEVPEPEVPPQLEQTS